MCLLLQNSRWEDTAHGGPADRADMVFQKKYIGCLWVCLRMLIGRINSLVRLI